MFFIQYGADNEQKTFYFLSPFDEIWHNRAVTLRRIIKSRIYVQRKTIPTEDA